MTVQADGAPRRDRIDQAAALLLVLAGVLSVLPSCLNDQLEMVPLISGLGLLLFHHARRQSLRTLYLLLLLLLLRIYLKGDERYLFSEISLFDYILIILGFAAGHQLSRRFWELFLAGFASLVPLAALVTHQLRQGPAALDRFSAGDLSINQTAFLLGCCLTQSLCFLWDALRTRRPRQARLLLSSLWSLSSLMTLALLASTQSRFGFGLPPLTVALIVLVNQWGRLAAWSRGIGERLEQQSRRIALLPLPAGWGAYWLLPLALVPLAIALWSAIRIYADPENVLSDMHRLYLLGCYFSAPFTGHNRFIHGMGFTQASQSLCKDIGLIKGTTHAHNIFAQVAADNGLFALLAVVAIGLWMLRQVLIQARQTESPISMATASLGLFVFATLLIEGGWGKVSFLQALIGLSLASLNRKQASPAAYLARASSSARSRKEVERSLSSS